MLSLILFALTTFAGAGTITIKPVIATRAGQKALVLLESTEGAIFAVCPFVSDVRTGSIGLDGLSAPGSCKLIGRRLRSGDEVARAFETFADDLQKSRDFRRKLDNTNLITHVPFTVAGGALVGLTGGVIHQILNVRNLSNLAKEWRGGVRPSIILGLLATGYLTFVDQLVVRALRRETPTFEYVGQRVESFGQGEVLLIEDGPGTKSAFNSMVDTLVLSMIRPAARDASVK